VYSPVLTGVITPPGVDADALRKLIHERFDLSLGTGLGKVKGRMFRIGHLGDSNDLTLLATLAGCEMGLKLAGVKLAGSGVQAAMAHFPQGAAPAGRLIHVQPEETSPCAEEPSSRPAPPPPPRWPRRSCARSAWPSGPVKHHRRLSARRRHRRAGACVSAKLTEMWKQQVIVENQGRRRRRAGGRIHVAAAAGRHASC
jgi:hypothetical protein